jgi:hypothetical protein
MILKFTWKTGINYARMVLRLLATKTLLLCNKLDASCNVSSVLSFSYFCNLQLNNSSKDDNRKLICVVIN